MIDQIGYDLARWTGDLTAISRWKQAGFDYEADVLPAVRSALDRERRRRADQSWRPSRLSYFDDAIADFRRERVRPMATATDDSGAAAERELLRVAYGGRA